MGLKWKLVPSGPSAPAGPLAEALAEVPEPRRPYGRSPGPSPLPLIGILRVMNCQRKQAACGCTLSRFNGPPRHRRHDGCPGTARDGPRRDVVRTPDEGAPTTDGSSLTDAVGLVDLATRGAGPPGAPRIRGHARQAGLASHSSRKARRRAKARVACRARCRLRTVVRSRIPPRSSTAIPRPGPSAWQLSPATPGCPAAAFNLDGARLRAHSFNVPGSRSDSQRSFASNRRGPVEGHTSPSPGTIAGWEWT